MRTVALPDPVYAEAERAAAASGLSLEAFVLGAVQNRLEDEASVVLSPEQIAKVRQAQLEVRAGKSVTLEQFDARFAERRDEWLRNHPDAH